MLGGGGGVRVTPSGQQRRQREREVQFDFTPFREDFQFIINKLRAEHDAQVRMRQFHQQQGSASIAIPAPPAAHVSVDIESLESEDEDHQLVNSNNSDNNNTVSESNNNNNNNNNNNSNNNNTNDSTSFGMRVPLLFGQKYSILQHGLVNEMIEQQRRRSSGAVADVREALSALVPRTRRGWLLVASLLVLVAVLWTVASLREADARSTYVFERSFWWGFLLQTRGASAAVARSRCRVSPPGSQGRVVDSRGVQCDVGDLDRENCCSKPIPADPAQHCRSCRDKDGCCATFEDCVECCHSEDHYRLIQFQVFALSQNAFPGLKWMGPDRYELCSALCRSSSANINVHGKFLDDTFHHCYLISDARANVWLGKLKDEDEETTAAAIPTVAPPPNAKEEPPKG